MESPLLRVHDQPFDEGCIATALAFRSSRTLRWAWQGLPYCAFLLATSTRGGLLGSVKIPFNVDHSNYADRRHDTSWAGEIQSALHQQGNPRNLQTRSDDRQGRLHQASHTSTSILRRNPEEIVWCRVRRHAVVGRACIPSLGDSPVTGKPWYAGTHPCLQFPFQRIISGDPSCVTHVTGLKTGLLAV